MHAQGLTRLQNMGDSVKVAVRVRPFNSREVSRNVRRCHCSGLINNFQISLTLINNDCIERHLVSIEIR